VVKDNRGPAIIVLDTSYLLDSPPGLREMVAGARADEVKGLIPDTVLAELEWYARHPEKREKAWLAAQILRLLQEGFRTGEVEYLEVRPKECPPPPELDPRRPEDQVLVAACQVKKCRPDQRILLATGDEKLRAKAAGLGIEPLEPPDSGS
jgi:predicted ribonuclease YlaK